MLRKQKVSQLNPFADEMSELNKKLTDLNNLKIKQEKESAKIQSEIDRIEHQVELSHKDLEAACEKEIQQI